MPEPGRPHVGDVGIIKRIIIADPDDGDGTTLMFDVKCADKDGRPYPGMYAVADTDIGSLAVGEAWLRQQFNGPGGAA